ncbi:MAG: DeoR/GlpR transcriptional regulator, partial [Clostridium sp.]|nr:DeoR/GlpR transcriptional regulator [Clostridium sp.]
TVGAFTVNEIKKFKIDKAFIGAGGINIEDNFVSNFNLDEVSTKEAIIKASKKKYLITINEKFYNDGLYKFCELGDVDYIITDKKPEENIIDGLSKYNVKVIY